MLAPIIHEFCRILNWFCLLSYTASQKYLLYATFFYSNLQLPAYTAYGSLQKITNLMVRHLTRPYFLESCASEMLLWRCYTSKEGSRVRNKVPKMILPETNVETFNTFIGYAILFRHTLWTCFKVISQNCEEGFTIFLWIHDYC